MVGLVLLLATAMVQGDFDDYVVRDALLGVQAEGVVGGNGEDAVLLPQTQISTMSCLALLSPVMFFEVMLLMLELEALALDGYVNISW